MERERGGRGKVEEGGGKVPPSTKHSPRKGDQNLFARRGCVHRCMQGVKQTYVHSHKIREKKRKKRDK